MKTCIACGMPLVKKEDFALGDLKSKVCLHCVDDKGKIKSCEDIFEGGVNFFMSAASVSKKKAEKLVRKNMNSMEYWKNKKCDCLEGEEASDEEFQNVILGLSH